MEALIKQEVETAIYAAFPVLPKPVKFAAEGFSENYDFIVDIKNAFASKAWPEITQSDWHMTGLSFPVIIGCMSLAAFSYYLPSLFIEAIKENDFEYAIEAILPCNQKQEPRKQWQSLHDSFSSLQKDAIKKFAAYAFSMASADTFYLCQKASGLWE